MRTMVILALVSLSATTATQAGNPDAIFHPKAEIRLAAIERIGELGNKARPYIPILIKALSTERTPLNRSTILGALAKIDAVDDRVYKAVFASLEDPSLDVSCDATFLLWEKFGDHPLRDLAEVLNNKKKPPEARANAACALRGVLENHVKATIPKYIMDCIEANLFDENEAVRLDVSVIIQGIAKRQPAQAPIATMVKAFTTDKSVLMQINMRSALPNCGKGIVPYMKKCIRHEDEDIRFMTLRILEDLGGDARPLLPEIRARLTDRSERVKEQARDVLNALKEP